jgi:ethanolamine permease
MYFPLNGGFIGALGITDQMASIIQLPALYISLALYTYGYGKQLSALAHSRLLPSFMGWKLPNSKIPYISLLVGSVVGIVLLFFLTKVMNCGYYSPETYVWWNAAMMASYFTFMIVFASFIIFRRKYSNLRRSFTNPLGMYSAIYGIISFSLLFVGLMAFSGDEYRAFQYFVVFMVVCSIYYFSYAKWYQTFSEEEQNILFIVYLMKGNCFRSIRIFFLS